MLDIFYAVESKLALCVSDSVTFSNDSVVNEKIESKNISLVFGLKFNSPET